MGVPESNASLWIVCTEMVQIFFIHGAIWRKDAEYLVVWVVQGNRYSSDCHAVSDSKIRQAAIGFSLPQIKMIESWAMGFDKVHCTSRTNHITA